MKISKFINDLEDTTLHTSAFAKVAGDRYSSTGAQTFEQRMKIGQNRKVVRSYRDSLIGRGQGERSERPVTGRTEMPMGPTAERPTLGVPKPSTFREPPTRGFNPYS